MIGKIKKEEREGTTFLNMQIEDAIEIMLFVIFLSAVFGAIFKLKFIYVIFVAIIFFVLFEIYQHGKDRKRLEHKIDEMIEEKKREMEHRMHIRHRMM